MNEQLQRTQMVRIARTMYEKGYISGAEGNLSVRLSARRILITPSGLHKGFLQPEQLLIVNLEGKRVDSPTDANRALKPTSELPMHLQAYRQRADVHAVVHAHPPHAIALSIAGVPIADRLIPEVVVFLGEIAVTPYATPSSSENAEAIARVIDTHDAIVLAYHGSLTVGQDLMEAFMRLETVEGSAQIAYMLRLMEVDRPLPAEQLAKLQAQRRRLVAARRPS